MALLVSIRRRKCRTCRASVADQNAHGRRRALHYAGAKPALPSLSYQLTLKMYNNNLNLLEVHTHRSHAHNTQLQASLNLFDDKCALEARQQKREKERANAAQTTVVAGPHRQARSYNAAHLLLYCCACDSHMHVTAMCM